MAENAAAGGREIAPGVAKERRRRRRGRGFSLHVNILTAFTVLLVATIAILVSLAYYKNSRSVLNLAQRLADRAGASGINRTLSLLDPVGADVEATAALAALNVHEARDGALWPYLIAILKTTPQFQSIYLAFQKDGLFLQAFPIPPGTKVFGAYHRAPPPGARYALRVVRQGKTRADYSDVWTYITAEGKVVGTETSNWIHFDPRVRPWYKEAVEKRGLIWSGLLVFTSNKEPGIATAYPIIGPHGKIIGAAAASIATIELSHFLSHLDLGPHGVAMVVDEKDRLVAFPDPSQMVRRHGLHLSLVKAASLKNPAIRAAFAAYRAHPQRLERVVAQGHSYMATFIPFPKTFARPWKLVAVVRENDFVGPLKKNNRELVLLGIGLTLLGMILVTFLARWITKPITLLLVEIRKIQDFDLANPIALNAWITEVNQLIDALNMMKRALRTFGMFVPRDLVRDLVASGRPIELGGQDRTLTVMFTDIAGFTGISERMEAGELMVHVSRHLAAISRCIGEEFGTVDKYIGDAVMAFWGAPVWREDHALRGCVAALKARHAQAEINREWAAAGLPTMFVRIGLHTAPVIVGNVGSEARMSYTVIGDGVNVASRLEGVNKVYGTQICVSEAVVEAAGDAVLVRPLDRVAVKGRKTGELVYELVALRRGPPELLATPDQLEHCTKTAAAFAAYGERRWDEAVSLYGAVAERWPDDPVPPIFIARCQTYIADPPPADWSGVYEMKVK